MQPTVLNPRFILAAIGVLIAIVGATSAQAGQVLGQLTAIDASGSTVDIDGMKYSITPATLKKSNARDAAALLRGFRTGQAVMYDVERKELKSIQAVEGRVDLPMVRR